MKNLKKHEKSNLARLESLKLRSEQENKSKLVIHNALKNPDVTCNSHIKFDSSDSEDGAPSKKAELKRKSADDFLGFGSETEEEIVIKPRFEGKSMEKVLQLQSRVGIDERFKIDEKFIESDDDDDNVISEPADVELARNLAIAQQVVGPTTVKSSKRKITQFVDPAGKRYDPNKSDHSNLEITTAQEPNKSKKKKKKKEVAAAIPVVDKDRFYEISSQELKNVFGKSNEDKEEETHDVEMEDQKPFSLLGMLGRTPDDDDDDVIEKDEDGMFDYHASPITEKSSSNPFKRNKFKYDSSESDESEDEEMKIQDIAAPQASKDASRTETFFLLSEKNPLFTDAPRLFCLNKSSDEIRREWLEQKDFLVADYKKKHRDAVRMYKRDARNRESKD